MCHCFSHTPSGRVPDKKIQTSFNTVTALGFLGTLWTPRHKRYQSEPVTLSPVPRAQVWHRPRAGIVLRTRTLHKRPWNTQTAVHNLSQLRVLTTPAAGSSPAGRPAAPRAPRRKPPRWAASAGAGTLHCKTRCNCSDCRSLNGRLCTAASSPTRLLVRVPLARTMLCTEPELGPRHRKRGALGNSAHRED